MTQARPLKGPDENPDFPRTPVGTTHGVSPGCRQYLQVDREALWRTRDTRDSFFPCYASKSPWNSAAHRPYSRGKGDRQVFC